MPNAVRAAAPTTSRFASSVLAYRSGCRLTNDPSPMRCASSTMRSSGIGTGCERGRDPARGRHPVADGEIAERAPAVDGEERMVRGGLDLAAGGQADAGTPP